MLFQAALILYTNFLDLIISALSIAAYLLLIISSIKLKKNGDRIKNSNIFGIIGILEILSIFIIKNLNQFFQSIPYLPLTLSYLFAFYFIVMVPAIISLNTFGILFIILGRKNKENHGKKLVIAGILWTIFQLIFIFLFQILYIFIGNIIPFFAMALLIVGRIFFVIYAFKAGERYLKCSAIILLNAILLYVIYLILDPYWSILHYFYMGYIP
ncbi:MAG: hypothetical protein ACFE8M_04455 [Candidatus Hermodarchaeota archaeon]